MLEYRHFDVVSLSYHISFGLQFLFQSNFVVLPVFLATAPLTLSLFQLDQGIINLIIFFPINS